MKSIIFFLALLAFSEGGALKNFKECPHPETIAPYCSCKEFDVGAFAMMHCQNLTSAEDLFAAVKATKGFDIMAITIADSTLDYIPENTFKDTKFQKILFSQSRILSLSDTSIAFKGLENHLQEISATGGNYNATWDWNQLKNLGNLQSIDIQNIEMIDLQEEFPALPSLTALGISRANLSFINKQAFQNLKNLILFVLEENEISALSRNMLPKPALKLYHIDLRNNHLTSLPKDMFSEMPSLREVLLTNNRIETLSEETFSKIFNSLYEVKLGGNQIRCDCRLRWLVGHSTPFYFEGACDTPSRLNGHSLKYLRHEDLYC